MQIHTKSDVEIIETGERMKKNNEKANKKYKDSVFVDLFYEDEKAKENELSLYNALFGTNYTLEDVEIEIGRPQSRWL